MRLQGYRKIVQDFSNRSAHTDAVQTVYLTYRQFALSCAQTRKLIVQRVPGNIPLFVPPQPTAREDRSIGSVLDRKRQLETRRDYASLEFGNGRLLNAQQLSQVTLAQFLLLSV